MTDLIGCLVKGGGWKGRVRAVTFDSGGRIYLWVEDEWGDLRQVGGYSGIRIPKEATIPAHVPEGNL